MRITEQKLSRHPPPGFCPRPHVIVTLGDEAGHRGRGDASPLPPFSREDAVDCERALAGAIPRLDEIDDDAPPAGAVAAALRRLGRGLDEVPSARFALETALFELVAQQRGLSVASCLDGRPTHERVPVNALLLPEPVESLAERAAGLAA